MISLADLLNSSVIALTMSAWRSASALKASKAAVLALVMTAMFLRCASAMASTLNCGNLKSAAVGILNSPNTLVKSTSAKGNLKVWVIGFSMVVWFVSRASAAAELITGLAALAPLAEALRAAIGVSC